MDLCPLPRFVMTAAGRGHTYNRITSKRNHVCLESMRRWQPTSCWCLMISFPHPGLTTIPHTPPSSRQCRQPRVKARPWAGSPHLGKLESSSPAISIKHRVNTLLYWATLTQHHQLICSCSDLPITPRSRQRVHTLYGYWAIRARSAVLGFVLCKK